MTLSLYRFMFLAALLFPPAAGAMHRPVSAADTTRRSRHRLDELYGKQLKEKDWTHNREGFKTEYSFDDMSGKIIDFYFDKMEENKKELRHTLWLYAFFLCPLSLAAALAVFMYFSISISIIFFLVALVNLIILVNRLSDWALMKNLFNTRRLLQNLVGYRKTGQVNDNIKKYQKGQKK